MDVREDAEATNGRRGEEGTRVGSSNINYALDENGMWEMEHIFENDDPEAEAAMLRDWKALLEKYGAKFLEKRSVLFNGHNYLYNYR